MVRIHEPILPTPLATFSDFRRRPLDFAHAGNSLDESAYQCVDVVVRNRQNQLRPSSPLWPVVTRRAVDNLLNDNWFTWRVCGAQHIILTLFGTMGRNFFYLLFIYGCQFVPGFSMDTKEFV